MATQAIVGWAITIVIFIITQVLTSVKVSSKYYAQVEALREEDKVQTKQIEKIFDTLDQSYVKVDMCNVKHANYDAMITKMTELSESVAKLTTSNEYILNNIKELTREVRNGKTR